MGPDEGQLKSLFIQSLEGDQVAYREFLSKLSLVLQGYVRRQLVRLNRADNDVEDIVQEVLLAIHNRRHTYDRVVPVTAWAHGIARYKLIDFLRVTERLKQNVPLDEIEEIIDDDDLRIQTAFDLRKLIATLPDRMRTSITHTKIEGYSVAETAAKTGTTETSVKVNIHRGLKTLSRVFRGL
jgi:RNA polymerase sigma-70 factor (ECF subfamily)